jgi:Flp pilus assembly protein TadD
MTQSPYPMRLGLALLALGLLLGTALSVAADPSRPGMSGAQEDPAYTEGLNAVKRGDYSAAISAFEGVVAKDDQNANAYNMLAYSIRRRGDAARAIPIYQKALAIDPKHRGAHEYIGEAYLLLGDLPKAKEHLAVLDKLCFLPCGEYSDLKKAVKDYEANGGGVRPARQSN